MVQVIQVVLVVQIVHLVQVVQVARGVKVVKVVKVIFTTTKNMFPIFDCLTSPRVCLLHARHFMYIEIHDIQDIHVSFGPFLFSSFGQVIQLWSPCEPGFGFNWNWFEKSQSWEEAGKHLIQTRFILKFNFS